ncbi:LysR family transcriptional regulator [Sinorhizobium meliloti]|uniref:LysR family transcriptional regulator n=1 Tax=Rhizobium meliloti TaxID=382 RepID=UPI0002A59275|nr:LysR family transcriptional regulator [Sinorhizobium meliloti]AGA11574.1 Transcriptional regulator [Sinorhizobium meliloti GR4]RVK95435.1 LysR family transcriptional regulator [Sinorhizobium meliloti]RVM94643.1 LysR family transcriptional regulator [Sinorhizobium meliloti]RVN10552.1 LysR family transcriptional regulator [Sinorhizobium meliloti]
MNVTLRQLQAFIAVAELGRFHLAADHLGLTQSAISILIKDLEVALKHRLFDRHTRMVSLTTAGAEFLPQARKVMSDLEIAVANVHELASLQRGRVTIAAAIVLAATLLPPVIARFVKRYPDISVQVRDMPEEEIRSALKRNEADLGIGTVSADDPEIQASVLMRDQLTLICRSDHRFAKARQVSWASLAGEGLIGLAKDNPLRGLVDRALIASGVEVKTRYEVRFSTTAISMVAEGLGIAILPENSRQLTTNVDVRIVELIDPVISRNISILQYRQPMLSPAAAKMKEFLMGASRKLS